MLMMILCTINLLHLHIRQVVKLIEASLELLHVECALLTVIRVSNRELHVFLKLLKVYLQSLF